MTPLAALAVSTLLLAAPVEAPAASSGTAEVCVVGHGAPRRDPLLSFLARVENTVAEAKDRPLSPPRKANLMQSLDDKLLRVRTRRDYLRRRLSDIQRDLSDLEAFETRAGAVRRALETAPTEAVGTTAPVERKK
jgi:hypothetical protein